MALKKRQKRKGREVSEYQCSPLDHIWYRFDKWVKVPFLVTD